MKMLLCNDLLLESICNNIIDVNLSHDWRELRNEKFLKIVNRMENENISYMTILGTLFSNEYVSERAIDNFFDVVNEHKSITFFAILDEAEFIRVAYRKYIPNNLHVYDRKKDNTFFDEQLKLSLEKGSINVSLYEKNMFVIYKNEQASYMINGTDEGEKIIPHFEATSYDDLKYKIGYGLVEMDPQFNVIYHEILSKKFSYKAMELTVSQKNSQDDIIEYLLSKISDFEYETILHINFVGKVSFASILDKEKIKNTLQNKLFYVEISDNTTMTIDEKLYTSDISLKSEFIRTAVNDSSLDDITRNKILCYGCNALAGKEIYTV